MTSTTTPLIMSHSEKRGTSFRFSNRCQELLAELSTLHGISMTAVVEQQIRLLERRGAAELQDTTLRRAVSRARDASSPLQIIGMRLSTEARTILTSLSHATELPQAVIIEIIVFGAARKENLH